MSVKDRIVISFGVVLLVILLIVKPLHASIFTGDLYGVEVVGNNYWVCGANGKILHSNNGTSWVLQESGVDVTLTSISFVNDKKGFCVGYGGTVLKTEDGGNRWVKAPVDTKYFLTGVYFINEKRGFIIGEFGTLLVSDDGGEHWKSLLGKELDAIMQGIDFYDGKYGWLVGEFGLVYHSEDAGHTWKKVNVGAEEYTLFSVKAIDKNRVVITSMDGLLFVTENGGRTWKKKNVGVSKSQLLGAESMSNNEVYIFGRGVLYKTTVELSTFQNIDLGKDLTYGWIYRIHKNTGVGNEGYIYKYISGKWSKERVKYNIN